MRSDMAKVIVERPRLRGSAWNKPKGYQRRLRKFRDGVDGPAARESMKARWQGHTKSFNEHLGPLRRYLDSQVGRPWDKVFSEICAHINRNSAVQDHVRDHVEDYVTIHVILVNGIPCNGSGDWHHGRPLYLMPWVRWYVCPRTGLLKRVKRKPRRAGNKPKIDPLPRYIRLSKTLQCRLINGVWHLVTLTPLPTIPVRSLDMDIVLNRPVAQLSAAQARKHYGAAVYAVAKRPLAKKELAQFPIPIDLWR